MRITFRRCIAVLVGASRVILLGKTPPMHYALAQCGGAQVLIYIHKVSFHCLPHVDSGTQTFNAISAVLCPSIYGTAFSSSISGFNSKS